MFRFPAFALLCLAATPAFAQAQTTPPAAGQAPAGPPAELMTAIQQAGDAFNQCLQTGVQALPATVTPEAGAHTVLNGCSTQRRALDQAAQALIAAVPEAQRPMVEQQIQSQLGAVEGQVVAGIQAMRNAPATTPAPAPAQ